MPKCNRDQTMARVVIRNITERLRVRQRLPCFHDPSEQQENALLTRQHGDAGALQSLLWPSCVLTIGLIIVLMVKLTQYLSTLCDNISRDKRWGRPLVAGRIIRIVTSKLLKESPCAALIYYLLFLWMSKHLHGWPRESHSASSRGHRITMSAKSDHT